MITKYSYLLLHLFSEEYSFLPDTRQRQLYRHHNPHNHVASQPHAGLMDKTSNGLISNNVIILTSIKQACSSPVHPLSRQTGTLPR